MITAERKPMDEIIATIKPYKRIILAGCNECVTVCAAGGRKEVGLLSSALQMAFMKEGQTLEVKEITLERQCDPEYVEELVNLIDDADCVLSMACGCGVQEVARRYKEQAGFPRGQHQVHGRVRASGRLGGKVPGMRRLYPGPHRRSLSGGSLFQAAAQRPLWRIDQGQMRNQPGCRLRLAVDLGPDEGFGNHGSLRRNYGRQGLAHQS